MKPVGKPPLQTVGSCPCAPFRLRWVGGPPAATAVGVLVSWRLMPDVDDWRSYRGCCCSVQHLFAAVVAVAWATVAHLLGAGDLTAN